MNSIKSGTEKCINVDELASETITEEVSSPNECKSLITLSKDSVSEGHTKLHQNTIEKHQVTGVNLGELKLEKRTHELSEGEITDDDDTEIPANFDDFSKEEFLEGLDVPTTRETQSKSKRRQSRKRRRKQSRSSSRGRNPRSYSSEKRDRSRSPYQRKEKRKRADEELEKYRESFLEEIREKLNNISNTAPPPAPTTVNVTHVVQIPPVIPLHPSVVSLQIPLSVSSHTITTLGVYDQKPQGGSPTMAQLRTQFAGGSANYEDFVAKLFTEKKISLSDYLSITAKREVKSSNPAQLQQKIKVISLCQDAIKLMSYKFRGPLKVQRSFDPEVINSYAKVPHQSPLLKSQIKFKYTSFNKQAEGDPFSNVLHDILQRINVLSDRRDVDELMSSVADALIKKETNKEVVANILKISLLGATKKELRCKPKSTVSVSTQCMKGGCSVGVQCEKNPSETNRKREGKRLKEEERLRETRR